MYIMCEKKSVLFHHKVIKPILDINIYIYKYLRIDTFIYQKFALCSDVKLPPKHLILLMWIILSLQDDAVDVIFMSFFPRLQPTSQL